MKRSREESRGDNNNRIIDEVPYPRLNLPLTISPELINLIEPYIEQQTESSKTSIPPKNTEKLKALNSQISMIIIGNWTFAATNPDDIVAKFYFAKKKLLWEFLCDEESETNMPRLKRKIEIQWDDVSSFQESINARDETGILKIELRKRPTFFIETNPQPGKHTQWKQMDQDFTGNQAASFFRRHTLHFPPGVLQKNLEKLMSNSFWSKLYKVRFPLQDAIYFDIDYGSNNNTTTNNSSRYIPSQTPRFNVNSDLDHHTQGISRVGLGEGNNLSRYIPSQTPRFNVNSDLDHHTQGISRVGVGEGNNSSRYIPSQTPHFNVNSDLDHHTQGISRVGVGEGKFNMAAQFWANDGWQNSYSQANCGNNTANELFGTQAIPPLTQVINEHYNMQNYFTGSRYSNLMIQDESEKMQNTREILGNQAYALPETQTSLMMSPQMNVIPMYAQVGPYLAGTLLQEELRQHTEHTHPDGNPIFF